MKTHTEILATLEEIESLARLACWEAYEVREQIHGAINWATMAVYDVRYYQSIHWGDEGFEVHISGADENQPVLGPWMRKFFLDRGYTSPPEFRFEW